MEEIMKTSTAITIIVILFIGSVVGTWLACSSYKDKEFKAALASAPHKRDTSIVHSEVRVPAAHHEVGPLPPHSNYNDSTTIDAAFRKGWSGGVDSMRAFIQYIASPIDTTLGSDSTGSVRVRVDPLRRMFIADFQPAPINTITYMITDSAHVPIFEHDSFGAKATIFIAGTAMGAIIYAIAR
jgi:hypothetical protein